MKPFYNKLFLAVVLLLGILGDTTAQAQIGGIPVWTNRYNGPGNGDDHPGHMALDANGNVFVTGNSTGSGSDYDYATIKYSSAGVPLWTNRYNGPGNSSDYAGAVALDTNGNVFVTGTSWNGTSDDYLTIKYSNVGVPLWTNRFNGPANGTDRAGPMALDTNGNVFVTGSSYVVVHPKRADLDYTTIKYSNAGVPLWTNYYNGPSNGDDSTRAVAVDGGGNVIVTGSSIGNVWPDYATVKYSNAGVPLWTNRYSSPGNGIDEPFAVAVDTNGNVFVTGNSSGTNGSAMIKYSGAGVPLWTNFYSGSASASALDGGGNVFVTGYVFGNGSSEDYATIKYSGAGVALWTNYYNGPANDLDYASAMALDGNGNVFVTGQSWGGDSHYDCATIAYSGAGVPLWTNRYNGPENFNEEPSAVVVDRNCNVFVTGGSPTIASGWDYATIKYSLVSPSLTIVRTTTNTVVISWPSPSTGFTLQSTTNLVAPVVWNTNSPAPTIVNGQNTVINPISGTQSFYRLSQ